MSQYILWHVENSTSFIYDVELKEIVNLKTSDKWVHELADICTVLSQKGFKYNVDESYNIINLRSG